MRTKILFITSLLAISSTAHGMGHKKMNVTELKGVTESQMAKSPDSQTLSVMVRGRAAELLYKTLDEKRVQNTQSAALDMVVKRKDTSHWTVQGKQVTCSRIQRKAAKVDDYACAFELDPKGEVAGKVEPFNPGLFDLAKTQTNAKLFSNKRAGRVIASAHSPELMGAKAYVMFEDAKSEKGARDYKDAMIVFKGKSAREIMGFLSESKEYREFVLAGAKGVKGKEISCLHAKGSEPDRCAMVVSLDSGSVSTQKNPLFR